MEHKQKKEKLNNLRSNQSIKNATHRVIEIQKDNDKLLKNLAKITFSSSKNRMTNQLLQSSSIEVQTQKLPETQSPGQQLVQKFQELPILSPIKMERKSQSVGSLHSRVLSLNIVKKKLDAEKIAHQNKILTERIIYV